MPRHLAGVISQAAIQRDRAQNLAKASLAVKVFAGLMIKARDG